MVELSDIKRLHELEEHWLAKERARNRPDPDLWRWSPVHFGVFGQMLRVAIDAAGATAGVTTFFEAGCGIGTKLALARLYGLVETGWEVFDEYVTAARELGVNVQQHDLRNESPLWYQYDIVYIARPFKDDEAECDWEIEVQRGMRPGAVLIASHLGIKPYTWRCFHRGPWRGVWRKPLEVAIGQSELSRDQVTYATEY